MSFNNGQVPGHIHWEVGAGTLAGIATAEFDERNWDAPAPKQPPRVIGGDRCAGYLIAIYRFPENDGQLEGHDVALATAAGDHLLRLGARLHPRRRRRRDAAGDPALSPG